MGMTAKQKTAIEAVYKAQMAKGATGKISRTIWLNAIGQTGVRVPWKLINPYKDQDDKVDFEELYQEAGIDEYYKLEDEESESEEVVTVQTSPMDDMEDEYINKRKRHKISDKDRLHFSNPVFVVEGIDSTEEAHVIGVAQSLNNAWKLRRQALHDAGDIEFEDFELMIETKGYCMIRSLASKVLRCRIRKLELMP